MKKIDITSQISGIDPKYLDEALTYRAPRFNKIKIIALAACIAVLVTAIPLTLILNRENGNTEDLPAITTKDNTVIDKPEPDKEEPLVIFCSSPTELEQQLKADANVEIKDLAKRKKFTLSVSDIVINKKDGTPYIKTIAIGNETFKMNYVESRACETYQTLSHHLKNYASYDRYSEYITDDRGVGGLVESLFSQETGKLIYYSKSTLFLKKGDLGEEKLHKIALEEISKLYDIDIANDSNYRYECRHFSATSPYHPEDEYYIFTYRKYINGCETDEIVAVCLDTSGQIMRISQNLGLYDEVSQIITIEKINNEKEKFKEQIRNKNAIQETEQIIVSLDNYGKCSIRFVTLVSVNDIGHYYDMYVEITK